MNTIAILLATTVLGVDFELVIEEAKEPVYVVTIERELIDQLADGFTINSSLPDNAKDVRQIRIQFAPEASTNTLGTQADIIAPDVPPESSSLSASAESIDSPKTELVLTPDESLIPESTDSLTGSVEPNTTLPKLEPEPLELPALSSDISANTTTANQTLEQLLPEFDQPVQVDEANRELELLNSAPKVVIIDTPESAPESAPAVEAVTLDPQVPQDPQTNDAPNLEAGEEESQIPDLINTHKDEFVALSSLNAPVKDEVLNAPVSENNGRTDLLLLLMFSITLNLFLGVTIFRIYRN